MDIEVLPCYECEEAHLGYGSWYGGEQVGSQSYLIAS